MMLASPVRCALVVLVWTSTLVAADYIRSDEITLEDNLEADAQIINLNRLMENAAAAAGADASRGSVFKLVNDSSLVNYIDLRYLDDDSGTAVIILKKRLNYEDICDESSSIVSNGHMTCQQTLKIVAINENDFIEIPIEVKKVLRSRKIRAKVTFDRDSLQIKPSALSTSHLIDYPRVELVQNPFQRDLEELVASLDFSLSEMEPQQQVVQVRLEKKLTGARKLKLAVQFVSENELLKAYESKREFKFRLVVFLTPNMTRRFELINETSHAMTIELIVSVDDLNVLNLTPLDFEYPIYSVSLESSSQKPLDINDTVLEPRLKSSRWSNNSIVFSLFTNDPSSNDTQPGADFPFIVDGSTGVIRLRKSIFSDDNDDSLSTTSSSSSNEKIFNFGIKATYRNLDHQSKSSYYSYMLPAYAKIQISLRSTGKKDLVAPWPQVAVRAEIVSPFVSRYEILNEDSNNQTLILFINDPFSINSKLIKLHVHKLTPPLLLKPRRLKPSSNSSLYWVLDNYDAFYYDDKSTNLTLLNRVEFRDQSVYRTNAKLHERLGSAADRVIAEVNVHFRVDFDPLLFEKSEYSVQITPATLVGRNLLRVRLKSRLKSIINNNKQDNVTYRLAVNRQRLGELDRQPFEIGLLDGWLRARKEFDLTAKRDFFDLEIIAVNLDLQKSASVKCKVFISCDSSRKDLMTKASSQTESPIRFSLFDNSPNRTQIGIFKSVCSNPDSYSYQLDTGKAQLKICQDDSLCRLADLNRASNWSSLFTMTSSDGFLMTNAQITRQSLLSLVQADAAETESPKSLSVLLTASIPNLRLTYPVEIAIQSVPRLDNFVERLVLFDREIESEKSSDSFEFSDDQGRCVYNYRFAASGVESVLSRFVRVDKLSATHQDPEFKLDASSSCSSSFFIYNNGCVAVKWGPGAANDEPSSSSRRCQVLKAGEYKLEFKLCFHDANKVSCSPLYNQTIVVERDIFRSANSKIKALTGSLIDLNGPGRLELGQRDGQEQTGSNLSSFFVNKRQGFSVYLMGLLVVICAIALIALVSFLLLFLRPRRYTEKKASKSSNSSHSDDKVLVLPGKNFRHLEISTESTPSSASSSSSRTGECSNTPETSSNAATTCSKVSKIEDENNEGIQVVDDFLSKTVPSNHQAYHQNHQVKYVYSGPNNFNYGGSFSSIGSSSCDSSGNNLNAVPQARLVSDQQGGLYSVKTASIHFNVNHLHNSSGVADLEVYDTQQRRFLAAPIMPGTQSSSFMPEASFLQQPALHVGPPPKNNSLKKLKKDLAFKKTQPGSSLHVDSSLTSSSSLTPNENLIEAANDHLVYEYINRKEVILNPTSVIASVV